MNQLFGLQHRRSKNRLRCAFDKAKNGRFLMWEPAIILFCENDYNVSMKNSMAFFIGSRSSLTVENTK